MPAPPCPYACTIRPSRSTRGPPRRAGRRPTFSPTTGASGQFRHELRAARDDRRRASGSGVEIPLAGLEGAAQHDVGRARMDVHAVRSSSRIEVARPGLATSTT